MEPMRGLITDNGKARRRFGCGVATEGLTVRDVEEEVRNHAAENEYKAAGQNRMIHGEFAYVVADWLHVSRLLADLSG